MALSAGCPAVLRAADDDPADDSAKEFAKRYGDQIRKVLGTQSNSDDLDLAKKLIADAPRYYKKQGMLILMGQRAYELASTAPGDFALAGKAIGVILRYVPDKRLEWAMKLVSLRQRIHLQSPIRERSEAQQKLREAYEWTGGLLEKNGEFYKALVQYRRALNLTESKDESTYNRISQRIQTQPFRQRTHRKLKRLLAQLKSNPNNRSAGRAIVDVYIVELNDPKSAKEYAPLLMGRQKQNVELVDVSSSKLSNDDCWEMAMWYQTYADTALEMYRPPLLARARDLFKRFLRSPSKTDPRVAMAYAKLRQVDQRIRNLPHGLPDPRISSLAARSSSSSSYNKKSWQDKRDKERERDRDEPAQNAITIEVEQADMIKHPFEMRRDRDASGGSYGLVANRTEAQEDQMTKPSPGRIVFYVNMPKETTAEISGRVRALPNSINSFFVSVSPGRDVDAKMRSWVFNTSPNKWQWARYGSVKFKAGVNTIVVAGREAGAGIDAIRITPRN